jgi:hypothetical protein
VKYPLVSIKTIIAKVYRDLDFDNEQDNTIAIIEWAGEAIELIGNMNIYIEKTVDIDVSNFMGELPCDFIAAHYVSFNNEIITESINKVTIYPTYKIEYPYIKTTMETGTVTLDYFAFPVDEEGLPMIVDTIEVRNAIFEYIATKMARIEYRNKALSFNEYMAQETRSNRLLDKAASALAMPSPMRFLDIAQKFSRLTNDSVSYRNKF